MGRNTKKTKPCHDTKKCVVTPKWLSLQPSCRDTNNGSRRHEDQPCRDTKKCVATPILPNQVATPKSVSRHYSYLAQVTLAWHPCRGRTLAMSRALLRSQLPNHECMRARPTHTQLPMSRHHLLCRDLVLEMGSSPSQFLPSTPLFFSFLFYPL